MSVVAAGVIFLSACGSSTTTSVTSPSTITRCAVTVNGAGEMPSGGGSGRLSVSASRECTWTASADGAWLSIKSGSNGQGDGAVEFAAVANPDPVVRRGAVVLNDQRIEVSQAAGECSFTLAASGATFSSSGGSGQVEVRASSALCGWTAQSEDGWITVRSDGTGKGTATVPFDVEATTGTTRSGSIRAAGQRFTITQTEGCAFAISPATISVAAGGGSGSIAVTTAPACTWTAASGASWLTIAPVAGTGGGVVSYSVSPSASARTGTAMIAGQTLTVTQAAQPSPGPGPTPCTFQVDPRSHNVGAGGGTVPVNVTTGAGCAWTASTSVPWVGLNGSGQFTGSGTVTFTVASSAGAQRSAALSVAGQTVSISQSGGCSYSVSPESTTVPAAGGPGKATISTDSGCTWAAASDAPWIQIVGSATGSGNGEVAFQAGPSTGSPRTGTLTIAGRVVTVTQSGGCTFSISPEQRAVDAGGGEFDVSVSTAAGCTWTAASDAPWLTVREQGNGVRVTAAANSGPARTGTATIAGRTLTVNQAAAGPQPPACHYSVRPKDIKIDADAQIVRIEVRTSSQCAWTAVVNDPWIRIFWGTNGSGDGEVVVGVGENDGRTRKGSLTIAGETVEIEQKKD